MTDTHTSELVISVFYDENARHLRHWTVIVKTPDLATYFRFESEDEARAFAGKVEA